MNDSIFSEISHHIEHESVNRIVLTDQNVYYRSILLAPVVSAKEIPDDIGCVDYVGVFT